MSTSKFEMANDKQQHDGKSEANITDETIDTICKTSDVNPVIESVSTYALNISFYIPNN